MMNDIHQGDLIVLRKNVKLWGDEDVDILLLALGWNDRESLRVWEFENESVGLWDVRFLKACKDLEVLIRLPCSRSLFNSPVKNTKKCGKLAPVRKKKGTP